MPAEFRGTLAALEPWLVSAALAGWWIYVLVRAVRSRAVPWRFKVWSVLAYPVGVGALLLPRLEFPLGVAFLVLVVIGFVLDGLWLRTDLLGRFDDPARPSRPGRHRNR
ncbi:hypothetical protein [Micromonospora halophytica]|uniref:Uncharacterized protein n=1 Tax=Micromonospora halophytica TaxID=47864 RepID=A0A1C5H8H4_9ACTN|nr:hypothetical protein [Micromonospora halophytica]SCG42318.1 hypothetical protein GA0070560_103279 [Micromonospora halophytica]